jgi:hypothetical protein
VIEAVSHQNKAKRGDMAEGNVTRITGPALEKHGVFDIMCTSIE